MSQSYIEVVEKIEKGSGSEVYSKSDLSQWEVVLRERESLMKANSDKEGELSVKVQLVNFYLKFYKDKSVLQDIKVLVNEVLRIIEVIEKDYQESIDEAVDKSRKKIILSQLHFFYKLAEYHYTVLEKLFRRNGLSHFLEIVRKERLDILKRQALFEGRFVRFLFFSRLSFLFFLQKHVVLFAILSSVGVVLIWHGLWGVFDWIIAEYFDSSSLYPYLFTSFTGIVLLYLMGIFVRVTLGEQKEEVVDLDKSGELQQIEDISTSK